MKDNAPRLTSKGLISNINKDAYYEYLDEDLRDSWEAHNRFVEAANELKKKYGASGAGHLTRYSFNLATTNTLDVVVNWYPFRAKPKTQSA